MEPWKEAEIAFEQTMAGSYDFHYYSDPVSKAHLKKFLNLIRRYAVKNQIVLDVGGGTGPVAQGLIEQGYSRVVTVDISLAMLREAKKKLPGLTAIVCDGEHIPFKADSVWTVVCSSVLHHMPTPDGVLKDIKRVLAPYGMLIAQEPSKDHVMSLPTTSGEVSGLAMGLMHYLYRIEKFKPVSEPPIHEYHRAFTRDEIVSLFRNQFPTSILYFRSRFAFSCLFMKLRSPMISKAVLALDRLLSRNEGSVFHFVCGKEGGHRNLLKSYFRTLEQLRAGPDQHISPLFMVALLPLIALGRCYELYQRIRSKLGRVVY
jgi:ubiquinone/menaquinone biosynthesis C-methylase UbiE